MSVGLRERMLRIQALQSQGSPEDILRRQAEREAELVAAATENEAHLLVDNLREVTQITSEIFQDLEEEDQLQQDAIKRIETASQEILQRAPQAADMKEDIDRKRSELAERKLAVSKYRSTLSRGIPLLKQKGQESELLNNMYNISESAILYRSGFPPHLGTKRPKPHDHS